MELLTEKVPGVVDVQVAMFPGSLEGRNVVGLAFQNASGLYLCPGVCRIGIYLGPYYDGLQDPDLLVHLGNVLAHEMTHIIEPRDNCDIDANPWAKSLVPGEPDTARASAYARQNCYARLPVWLVPEKYY